VTLTARRAAPTLRQFLDFSDVQVQMHVEEGLFFASLIGPRFVTFALRQPLEGRLIFDDELMVAARILPREGLPLAQGLSRHHIPC